MSPDLDGLLRSVGNDGSPALEVVLRAQVSTAISQARHAALEEAAAIVDDSGYWHPGMPRGALAARIRELKDEVPRAG